MCDNKTCTLKETCYRFNAIANEFRQSYGVFKQDKKGKCDYYWKIKTKKYKIGSEDYLRKVINYMLREYNVTYDEVIKYKDGEIEGELWCNYYWDTIESAEEFKIWFKNFIKKECTGSYSKDYIDRIYSWFHLCYGLKIY
jgi:hypothetical protein